MWGAPIDFDVKKNPYPTREGVYDQMLEALDYMAATGPLETRSYFNTLLSRKRERIEGFQVPSVEGMPSVSSSVVAGMPSDSPLLEKVQVLRPTGVANLREEPKTIAELRTMIDLVDMYKKVVSNVSGFALPGTCLQLDTNADLTGTRKDAAGNYTVFRPLVPRIYLPQTMTDSNGVLNLICTFMGNMPTSNYTLVIRYRRFSDPDVGSSFKEITVTTYDSLPFNSPQTLNINLISSLLPNTQYIGLVSLRFGSIPITTYTTDKAGVVTTTITNPTAINTGEFTFMTPSTLNLSSSGPTSVSSGPSQTLITATTPDLRGPSPSPSGAIPAYNVSISVGNNVFGQANIKATSSTGVVDIYDSNRIFYQISPTDVNTTIQIPGSSAPQLRASIKNRILGIGGLGKILTGSAPFRIFDASDKSDLNFFTNTSPGGFIISFPSSVSIDKFFISRSSGEFNFQIRTGNDETEAISPTNSGTSYSISGTSFNVINSPLTGNVFYWFFPSSITVRITMRELQVYTKVVTPSDQAVLNILGPLYTEALNDIEIYLNLDIIVGDKTVKKFPMSTSLPTLATNTPATSLTTQIETLLRSRITNNPGRFENSADTQYLGQTVKTLDETVRRYGAFRSFLDLNLPTVTTGPSMAFAPCFNRSIQNKGSSLAFSLF